MKPDAVAVIGIVLLLLGIYVLWRAHRSKDSSVNLEYILVDGQLVPPRVSLAKVTGFGAWAISSWWLSIPAIEGKLDPTMFVAYITIWGAVKVAGDITAIKAAQ